MPLFENFQVLGDGSVTHTFVRRSWCYWIEVSESWFRYLSDDGFGNLVEIDPALPPVYLRENRS